MTESRETEHRIQAGNQAYYKYKSIMNSKEINRKTKMIVNGNIWS